MDDTLSFHQLDDVKFLRYMAGCKAYATTAGFESVCEAMEMGAAAIMANTAIATAGDIPAMAEAFKQAIEAGRTAYLAGLGRVRETASASSPLTGFLQD